MSLYHKNIQESEEINVEEIMKEISWIFDCTEFTKESIRKSLSGMFLDKIKRIEISPKLMYIYWWKNGNNSITFYDKSGYCRDYFHINIWEKWEKKYMEEMSEKIWNDIQWYRNNCYDKSYLDIFKSEKNEYYFCIRSNVSLSPKI